MAKISGNIDSQSPTEIKELTAMSGTGMAYDKWAAIEKDLTERSRIQLTPQTELPFSIAGNVRGKMGGGDPLVKELQISSGKNLLVKKYEFQIAK